MLIAMRHFSKEQTLLADIEKEAVADIDMVAKPITMLLALKKQTLKLLKMFLIVFG